MKIEKAMEYQDGTKFELDQYDFNNGQYLYFNEGYIYDNKDRIQSTIKDLILADWSLIDNTLSAIEENIDTIKDILVNDNIIDIKRIKQFAGWIYNDCEKKIKELEIKK